MIATLEINRRSVAEPVATTKLSAEGPAAAEQHYSPSEVASLWQLNVETIRHLFQNEPGVIVLQGPSKKGKRPYRTMRIPHSVLERVHKRLQR